MTGAATEPGDGPPSQPGDAPGAAPEAALAALLARSEAGADVSEDWLRENYPEQWRDMAEFLAFHHRLRDGRPHIESVGPYRLVRRLGQGGAGTVWLAERSDGGPSPVALKLIHPHLLTLPGFVERTLRESALGSTIRHPNVVRTGSVGLDEPGSLYVVMDYVEGQNLRGLLHDLDAVPEPLCRHIAREALRGLVAIHGAGVVHRDIKPENIVITPDERVLVMDLGAARAPVGGGAITASGGFTGSVLYAAPEQFSASDECIGPAADLFALGVVLHELVTGAHPLASPSALPFSLPSSPPFSLPSAGDGAAADGPPVRRERSPAVSPFFDAFVAKLMAPDPARRFASAATALDVLVGGETSAWWIAEGAERDTPGLRRDGGGAPPLGRSRELAILRDALSAAAAGRGTTVLVEGEAGVGKTRLLAALAADASSRHPAPLVLIAGPPSHDPSDPIDGLTSALRRHLGRDLRPESLAPLLGAAAPLASGLAAVLRGAPATGAAGFTADTLTFALAALLSGLAATRPVVLAFEDLHAAGPETWCRFRTLSLILGEARVVLVATVRPEACDASARCEGLRALRIPLERLGPGDTCALAARVLGDDALARRLLPELARRSGGNPFFLLELIRAMRDAGRIAAEPGRPWRLVSAEPLPLPETVRALVAGRLAGLAAEDRSLLETAACAGGGIDPGLVAAALGMPEVAVMRSLGRIARRRLLIRMVAGGTCFDHEVIREVLLSEIPPERLAGLRRRIASALAARAEADPGDAAATASLSVAIAEQFTLAGAPEAAGAHLAAGIGHLNASFRFESALGLAEQALGCSHLSPRQRLDVLLARTPAASALRGVPGAIDAVRETLAAAEALGDGVTAARQRAALATLLHGAGAFTDAAGLARQALADGAVLGDAAAQIEALLALANIEGDLGRHAAALGHAERASALCAGAPDCGAAALAHAAVGVVLKRMGRTADCARRMDEAAAAAGAMAETDPRRVAIDTLHAATLLDRGQAEGAVCAYERIVALAQAAGWRRDAAHALAGLGTARARAGLDAEGAAAFAEAIATAETIGDRTITAHLRLRAGRVHRMCGRLADSLCEIDRAAAAFSKMRVSLGEAQSAYHRTFAALHAGDVEAAAASAATARRLALEHRLGSVAPVALWAQGIACVADPDRSAAFLSAAVAEAGESFFGGLLGEMWLDLGLAELERGSAAAAAAAFDRAGRELRGTVADSLCAANAVHRAFALRDDPRAALAELRREWPRLPRRERMLAAFRGWEMTGERVLLDDAHAELTRLRDGAPAPLRSAVLTLPAHARIGAAAAAAAGRAG